MGLGLTRLPWSRNRVLLGRPLPGYLTLNNNKISATGKAGFKKTDMSGLGPVVSVPDAYVVYREAAPLNYRN
jgi:hypothetical protein